MKNIWQRLSKPIFALAPMEQVTDSVFRQIVASCGRPSVFFTEFTSVEGLDSIGKNKIDHRLQFTEAERPIVAQIWGRTPEKFYRAAQKIADMGFDGIDINMGCPDRSIVRKGSCGGLIQNQSLTQEIIQATREGAGTLPVSVKTRVGFNKIITEEWVRFLLEQNIAALTLHLRTVKEESRVAAHWDEVPKAIQLRNELKSDTIILGNGDIKSLQEGLEKVEQYKVDGVMIGRGIFESIWLFNEKKSIETVSPQEKFELLLKHIDLFVKTWGDSKNFAIMRKFVKAYVNGFPGASEVRVKLMETETAEELKELIKRNLIDIRYFEKMVAYQKT